MTDQFETLLATARRHVREGEERIAQQVAMIADLEQNQHTESTRLARNVLGTMRASLSLMKQHLDRLETQCGS